MSARPPFLVNDQGENRAHLVQRLYHGRQIMVWEGWVKTADVQGWVENPRIELERKKLQRVVGNRPLTQEEVFNLMITTPAFELKALRDDILQKGLRVPITLNFAGKLVDGNRRFFAVKYALDKMSMDAPQRPNLEVVPVTVLTAEATSEDERLILVEENFASSLKMEWPDLVRARYIINDAEELGMSEDEVARRYGWTKRKVHDTLRIHELIEEYVGFLTEEVDPEDSDAGGLGLSEEDAELSAAKNYGLFNEAQRSYFDKLRTDVDFKFQFFRWVHNGKFSGMAEVRVADRLWDNAELRSIMLNPANQNAAKEAKATLDYNNRVLKTVEQEAAELERTIRFLENLKAKDIADMEQQAVTRLQTALENLNSMVAATHTEPATA